MVEDFGDGGLEVFKGGLAGGDGVFVGGALLLHFGELCGGGGVEGLEGGNFEAGHGGIVLGVNGDLLGEFL